MLLATDGRKLFFFDVITHLLIEKYELGLLPSETVKSIRLSRDGDYLLVFIQNEFDAPSGKMYWMKMPNISGTPIP
jgi:hypothetical protein